MPEQERWLIVGLGNPGRRYAKNRHNVGFRCVDRLASVHHLTFDHKRAKAKLALGSVQGHQVILAQPQTFMNESGQAVAPLTRFYRVPPERMLVIYDDLDLEPGTVRLRRWGGSGGHKGMHSVIQQLGTQAFPRVRVGIGRPPGRMDPADYVLQDLSNEELPLMEKVFDWVVCASECWLQEGIEIAMTRFNANLQQVTGVEL